MKKNIKKIFSNLSVAALTLTFLTACGSDDSHSRFQIKVGTIAGPETELMEEAKIVAKQVYDLDIQIVEFTDYQTPNIAVAEGAIDANMFQTEAFFNEVVAARGYDLVIVGYTFIYPMGLYSHDYSALSDLPSGAKVAIPSDPSNEGRALLLLEKAGLITLKPDLGNKASVNDITDNPLGLRISVMDAAQVPRALDDVDLAAINTNYAMLADLLPSRDALFLESADSPYANIVVIQAGHEDDIPVLELMGALHSDAVQAKAEELFQGQAIPAW